MTTKIACDTNDTHAEKALSATQMHGTKAIIAAAGANLGIAGAKALAWVLTGSSSMLAEAIHSCADTANQFLLIIGGKRAKRAPNERHQFGYGRSRYLAAFIVAIMLFSVGGLFALFEAYHKFTDPHPITAWKWVPVVVLIVSIALECVSLLTAVKEANAVRGKQPLWVFIRRAKSPEIPVVLLEDIAALTGLVFALAGVSATLLTGDGRWDAVGSAAIGLLLIVVASFLGSETASMLMGESADEQVQKQVESALMGPGIERIIALRTLHIGPEELLITAKVAISATSSGTQIAHAIDQAQVRVRAQIPLTCLIYLEPDLDRS